MALHLVTGYAGTEHITSANDAAMNIHSVGDGKFVVKGRGKEFTYNLNSNNEIAIFDGDAYIDGRYFTMIPNTSEKLAITNGSQNMFRNDLVVARYTMNRDDGIERMELLIIEGDESSSEAEDPAYYNGSIEDGDNPVDFPLYRIRLNGLNVVSVEQMFEKKAVGSGIIGDTDISDIGDGTVTGSIRQMNQNLARKDFGTEINIESYTASKPFVCPTDGYIRMVCNNSTASYIIVNLNGVTTQLGGDTSVFNIVMTFVKKGMPVYIVNRDGISSYATFLPLE